MTDTLTSALDTHRRSDDSHDEMLRAAVADERNLMSQQVVARLHSFVDDRSRLLLDVSPDLARVVEKVLDLVAGGKRLRAAFCYWGWRGAAAGSSAAVVGAAASLELFHAAALVHDDLMDHSDMRRGELSAHRSYAVDHQRDHLVGDGDDFGRSAALLLGDLCLTWSDELMDAATGAHAADGAGARAVYNTMRSQVIAGQYLDILEQARPGTSRHAAQTVVLYKSAKYTVEHPLLLGATLAGAPNDLLAVYSAFGLAVGEAFQLRDDVLGVFGDPARTGKPVGDDLREGKKTMLVVAALDRADPSQRALLERDLGDASLDDAAVGRLQEILVDTGAAATVESTITRLVDHGLDALASPVVPIDVSYALRDLAVGATRRDA